jgi:RNA polymerase sigma-70 factor (ECF subfamily)
MARPFEIEELLAHAGWLRSLARSLIADPAAADDLVQDTWVAALRRPPLADRSPRPWLARVAHNLARNARRAAGARGAHEQRAEREHDWPTPDVIAEEVEAQRLLAETVAQLAEPARTIVVLRWFRGLDSAEIARELGVPAGTVRWKLKQALDELRGDLDRRGGGREAWVAMLGPLARVEAPPPAPGVTATASWLVPLATGAVVVTAVAVAGLRLASSANGRDGAPNETAIVPRTPASDTVAMDPLLEPPDVRTARIPMPDTSELAPGERELSGTVYLDGEPAALKVELLPGVWTELPRFARAGADGKFRFAGFPRPHSGTLQVPGYAFEDEIVRGGFDDYAGEIALHVKNGPVLTARFLRPDGRTPIPLPRGPMASSGSYECTAQSANRDMAQAMAMLQTDDEGRCRIPLPEGERVHARLLVEVDDVGRKVVEVPSFERAAGLDLGDIVLDPCVAMPFWVLDSNGGPIPGAWSKHEDWFRFVPDDRAILWCVPPEGVSIVFGATRYHDRVIRARPGGPLDVILERTSALDVRIVEEDDDPLPELRILIALSSETLFVNTGDRSPHVVYEDEKIAFTRSSPRAALPYCSVNFEAGSTGQVLLRDLAPQLRFTLEVRDADDRKLATRECSLGATEWQELVIPIER